MHRYQPLGHCHLGPGADAAEVMRIAERHDAAAVLLRAFDAELHRLMADHLAEAGVAVEREQAAGVDAHRDMRIRLQPAFEEGRAVARQHADAVRVVAGQVGLDQVVGDALDLERLAAETAHQFAHRGAQRLDEDRVEGGHGGVVPCCCCRRAAAAAAVQAG